MSVQRRDRHLAQPPLTTVWVFAFTQGVCPKTWQAHCFHFSWDFLRSHSVSVQGRDRSLFFLLHYFTKVLFLSDFFAFSSSPCSCLRSHSVSVQRRDRSLFFLLHCYTKVPLLTWLLSHSVSVQRRDSSLFFTSLLYQGLFCLPEHFVSSRLFCLFSGLLFFSHSVSVQRRDRSLFFSLLFLVTQCICPKTWQVLCYLLHPPPFLFVFEETPFSSPFNLFGFSYFLCEPIEVTPLLTLSFLVSVLSPCFTGLSVQRRGRYSPPPQSYLE